MNQKVLLGCVLLAICAMCGPQFVHAWGPDGHKIVAQIAQQFMSPIAWSACKAQLGNLNLADIATLPDSYDHNSDGSWSSHLHFANLPENATYFQLDDCVATDGCVVTAVYNYTYILYKAQAPVPNGICSNNSTASNMPEPCALSFLTHFVGDAHQPLHVSYQVDKGGNDFSVTYNGSATDLHSIWDSSMIMTYEDEYLSPHTWEAFAQELIDVLNQHPEWQYFFANQSDPRVWANESFHYTRDNCYNMQPGTSMLGIVVSYPESFSPADIPMPPRLNPPAPVERSKKSRSPRSSSTCDCPVAGDAYFGRNIGIIKSRLMMAGMRLAGLLDAIYAANASRFVRGETHAREVLQEFSVALKEFEAKRPGPEYAPEVYSCQH